MILENIVCKKKGHRRTYNQEEQKSTNPPPVLPVLQQRPFSRTRTKKIHKSSACSPCTPQKRRTNENQCRRDLIIKYKEQKEITCSLRTPPEAKNDSKNSKNSAGQVGCSTATTLTMYGDLYGCLRGLLWKSSAVKGDMIPPSRTPTLGGYPSGETSLVQKGSSRVLRYRECLFFALHSNNYTSALRFTFVQILRFLVFRVLSSFYVLSESQKDNSVSLFN